MFYKLLINLTSREFSKEKEEVLKNNGKLFKRGFSKKIRTKLFKKIGVS